jgi:TctA family transporter
MLQVPYRLLFPSALLFIAIGVYSTNNSLFDVGEVLVFGIVGALLMAYKFPIATVLLGYVLGPLVEENFRRALLLSNGSLGIFVESPISIFITTACALLILGQMFFALRRKLSGRRELELPPDMSAGEPAP